MILVTVGTQLPFDRLVFAVDEWARVSSRQDVFAQIGPEGTPPQHIAWARGMSPAEFKEKLSAASAVVAHAGMGTIINALTAGKPIVVLPRKASLGEHRNEHQIATVRELSARGRVHAAMDEDELRSILDRLDDLPSLPPIGDAADPSLIEFIRGFVHGRPGGSGTARDQ